MHNRQRQHGFSIIELLAVLAILGAVAAVAIARAGGAQTAGRAAACASSRGNIELQVLLWRRANGALPQSGLGDIAADPSYFPAGMPTCPVDGAPYAIDSEGRIVGHAH